jgi:hypothetical protein
MAQRLRNANVPFKLLVANNGIPHAFLNMKNLTYETQDAYDELVELILNLFNEFEIELIASSDNSLN